jgi:hypothetical protein
VLLRNFGQTCAGQSVSNDCGLIDVERHAIDLLAFESRPSHSSAHVLDHQVSLKLGDRSNNGHHRPSQLQPK